MIAAGHALIFGVLSRRGVWHARHDPKSHFESANLYRSLAGSNDGIFFGGVVRGCVKVRLTPPQDKWSCKLLKVRAFHVFDTVQEGKAP